MVACLPRQIDTTPASAQRARNTADSVADGWITHSTRPNVLSTQNSGDSHESGRVAHFIWRGRDVDFLNALSRTRCTLATYVGLGTLACHCITHKQYLSPRFQLPDVISIFEKHAVKSVSSTFLFHLKDYIHTPDKGPTAPGFLIPYRNDSYFTGIYSDALERNSSFYRA